MLQFVPCFSKYDKDVCFINSLQIWSHVFVELRGCTGENDSKQFETSCENKMLLFSRLLLIKMFKVKFNSNARKRKKRTFPWYSQVTKCRTEKGFHFFETLLL